MAANLQLRNTASYKIRPADRVIHTIDPRTVQPVASRHTD